MRSFKLTILRIVAIFILGITVSGTVSAQFAEKDFGQALRITTDAPVALSKYLHGSLRIVNTVSERDAITTARRQFGMIVIVMDDGTGISQTYMYTPPVGLDVTDATATWNAIKEDTETGTLLNKYWQTIQLFQSASADGIADTVAANIMVSDSILNHWLSSDTIYANTLFVDTIFSESQGTLVFSVPVKMDSIYAGMIYGSMAEIDSLVLNYMLAQKIVSDSASIKALFADTATINYLMSNTFLGDTAFISNLGITSLTMFDRYVTGISNDSLLSGADSLKLITEYSVQTRIDSVLEYVDGQFSALSQNMIEDTQDGETMVKVTDGDSLIVRIANDTTLLIDPNKNVSFTDATIVLNGDSIYEVADKGESFASEADSVKAVTSVATVDSMIADGGNDIKFAFGGKQITRAGWSGVTGAQLNTDNIEDFLRKVFFPVSSPLIQFFGVDGETNSSRYSFQTEDAVSKLVTDSEGIATLAFSNWNVDANYTLKYTVFNRSVNDESEDTRIDSVVWFLNGARQGLANIVNTNLTNQGTFILNTTDLNRNATGASSNALNIKVYDAYPNTSTINWTLNTNAAVRSQVKTGITVTHPSAEGSNPYLIERNGATQNFTVTYAVDANDETVSDVIFTPYGGITAPANETGLSISSNNINRTVTMNVENTNLDVVKLGVQVQGEIYGTPSTERLSPSIQLADRGYVGYLSNAQRLDLINQGNVIAGFSNPLCLLNYQFIAKNPTNKADVTDGITLTNNIGEAGFLCFAIPEPKEGNGNTYTIETYNVGKWDPVANTGVQLMNINTNGATVSYYVVFINTGSAVTNNGESVTARMIKN